LGPLSGEFIKMKKWTLKLIGLLLTFPPISSSAVADDIHTEENLAESGETTIPPEVLQELINDGRLLDNAEPKDNPRCHE
jgi:hypothetical protein